MYDKESVLYEAARVAGSSEGAARDFCELRKNDVRFQVRDGALFWEGEPFTVELLKTKIFAEVWPHYLPPKAEPDLADAAFLGRGNLTARGKLLAQVGDKRALEIAQSYGLKSVHDTGIGKRPEEMKVISKNGTADYRNNPFHKSAWNMTRQGSLIRSLGIEKTAAMARAVGVTIGATHPNPDY